MKSPLNSYYDGGRGEVYISEVGMIQQAANAVSKAAMDIDNASAESKAKRQGKRLDRMKKRKTTTGRTKRIEKVEKEAKRKIDYDTLTDEAYKKKYGVDKPSTNSNTTSNLFK